MVIRWEYAQMLYHQTKDGLPTMNADMARRGEEGWEAFAASHTPGLTTNIITVLFKRPLPEE